MTDKRHDFAFTAQDFHATTHVEHMFSGATSFCRRAFARDLAGVDVAVVGVPFDTAVTNRPGCRFGPRAIRRRLDQSRLVAHWPWEFDPFERLAVADWGDVRINLSTPQEVPAEIETTLSAILAETKAALVLGGDHFTTYPSLKAHAAKHGAPLALLHFDAHSDTWAGDPGEIDHGTMFHRAVEEGVIDPARSIQIGLRTTNDEPMGIRAINAMECHRMTPEAIAEEIRAHIGDAPTYLTFDIDSLDPSCAPGTGTPVVGGLFTWQALAILRGLRGINLVGMDVVEVSPPYDHAEITALAGATVALDLLCLYADRAAKG